MCRVSAWYNEQRTQRLAHRREVRIRRNKLKKIRSKANVARFVFFLVSVGLCFRGSVYRFATMSNAYWVLPYQRSAL